MVRATLRSIPALIGFGVGAGLQVSGLTNLWLAIAIWTATGLLGIYGAWPWLRRLHLQWPVVLERSGARDAIRYPNTSPGAIVRHISEGETYFKKKSVFLGEIGLKTPVIRDVTFEECEIVGRAVITFLGHAYLGDSTFYTLTGSYDELFMETHQGTHIQAGVVAFQDCQFRRCTFHSITFAGTRSYIDGIKQQMLVHKPLVEPEPASATQEQSEIDK
jgi:hypothetical protein